jgi:putative DNA primase/helicase
MSSPIQNVLDRVEHKSKGSYYVAKCPAHDDKRHSLSISESDDGKVLLRCHAGCRFSQIVAAMGIKQSDLFPTDTKKKSQIVAEYNYTDSAGKTLYQVVRLDPKSFRQRKPSAGGGWDWRIGNVRRVPYMLHNLDGASGIIVVEGEKDVHALTELGFTATTFSGGAGKIPPRESLDDLFGIGAELALIPDNDTVGIEWMNGIADMARKSGLTATVVRLPGLGNKQDVSDWLEIHNGDDLRKEIREAKRGESKSAADCLGELMDFLGDMPTDKKRRLLLDAMIRLEG